MRALFLSAILCLSASSAAAAPPEGGSEPSGPEAQARTVDAAVAAFNSGDWPRVRTLLEGLVTEDGGLQDVLVRKRALRYLADATLLDESMAPRTREELARNYIEALLEMDPEWSPPAGQHSPRLYSLTEEVTRARAAEKAAACDAELVACRAAYDNEQVLHDRLKDDHAALEGAYADQEVIEYRLVERNRAIALIPFGVGHFYNGNRGLGAAFLSAEVAFGGAGLGLLLWRTFSLNCRRTAGFAPGSLECDGSQNETRAVRARKTEEVMAWLTLGAFVSDIIVAQVLFKPYRRSGQTRRRRSEIEAEGTDLDAIEERRREERRESKEAGAPNAKLQWRPGPVLTPKGAGMGLRLRF